MGAIAWTTSELELIKKQTLNDLRPSYYSITNRNLIQISSDFEGYLILQGADDKKKLLTWMSDVSKINVENKEQNEILTTFLGIRGQDADDRITELDIKLNKYADMQADLITDGNDPSRYGSIVELSLMIRAISKSLDSIAIQREQAFHEKNMVVLLSKIADNEKVDENTQKELTSWQTVASTYKGQTDKKKSSAGKSASGGVF